ncbi:MULTISPECIES: TIGR03621 family F420-dependent LLM class oxidoreductase [unclassified Parafrankia]|uniref:TIGR03621 family F420-dependent LLM class oxidoreductase n=1 Tax=unclassified Parafrankia TaxID=2994368 RepID=UPI000DA56C19|nr:MULTISPECIES: TIGR03621 family F420-dependent LLM class oxidoreductase [unclassified Parafrankia]TCJ31383.1 TIGR03621 family F420-dependent LLM class oxidoreductase [Parafrankia sp. BMG5.11]SQD93437.1 conserved hypothetical protein [Parafrankia sp. Ea1.12]
MTLPFRFGTGLLEIPRGEAWTTTARRAEELGYDVLLVPDHIGNTAPLPALVAAAAVTKLRLGTLVLNTGFYNPVLLAREVATTDQVTGGRLELGLGTGYVREEFEALGLELGTARERVDQLERTLATLRTVLDNPESVPAPAQERVPLLVAGNGNRVLRLAAEHADIVGFLGMAFSPESPGGLRLISNATFAERVAYFADVVGERDAQVERNLLIQAVIITDDRDAALRHLQAAQLPVPLEDLDDSPLLLIGDLEQVTDRVRELRDRFGISYLTVIEHYQEAFAPVVEALRGT